MIRPDNIPKRTAWRTLALTLLPVLAGALAGPVIVRALDKTEVETRLKAAFIYNFARFVEWPARPVSGSVRIGILGRGDLGSPLEEVIKGKSVNGKAIEVRHISATTEADCCEILLIERSESKHLGEIVQSMAGKPALTVSDSSNCFREGGMICFQTVDESVRFQINQEAAERAGLKLSSQLLKVAIPPAAKHL